MIDRSTYAPADPSRYTGKGTVDVTINGETRKLYAIRNGGGIQAWGILGKLKGDDKQWQVRLIAYRKGKKDVEDIVVYNTTSPPDMDGKTWESFAFGKVWQVSL